MKQTNIKRINEMFPQTLERIKHFTNNPTPRQLKTDWWTGK